MTMPLTASQRHLQRLGRLFGRGLNSAEQVKELSRMANNNGFMMGVDDLGRRSTKLTLEDMDHTNEDSMAKTSRDEGKLSL